MKNHRHLSLATLFLTGGILVGCNNIPAKPAVKPSSASKPACTILDHYTPQDMATFGPPLSYAANSGDLLAAECLLKTGSDANATDPTGTTPLVAAIMKRNSEMVRLLLQYGANPNKGRRDGEKPLDIAHAKRHQTIIHLLKNAGATP
ncbi:MAG: ankyrin repeat domain-containing protein [Gammaproteobacteria bacterium]|nr:ankyrin repeat domain-containing protein [Gammaproteobacteria bacterium]MBU1722966.1 ankyrin repeat domain-containing protein [Gammaproteobacteria bacterium]MBU2005938.1 ankyrin repeat domain-containing protein [Gammaproteobacteria bacterium]